MYKKIKNSSFMNLIWFILCMLPLLIFLIYSINFYLNKEIYYQENTTIETNLINENNISYARITYNENNGLITWNTSARAQIQIDLSTLETNQSYTLYAFTNPNYNLTIQFNLATYEEFNNENYYKNFIVNTNDYVLDIFNDSDENYNTDLTNDTIVYLFLTTNNNLYYTYDFLLNYANENGLKQIKETYSSSDYTNYLNKFKASIETNGFISSAFLNLATLFGVNNIYYSLACYYIEYLLVIILLHLAFDLLYIVPNICHKFMEKIGGERD